MTEKGKEELSRRQFFGTAGKGVAASVGAVATVAAGGAQAAESPQREGGYRESAHVKTYYDLARF